MGDVELLRTAATQWGVVSRGQALKQVSRQQVSRRLESGRWERVHPATYRVEGAPRTWQLELKALSLWLERDFVFSHVTAASLWGFSDCETCDPTVVSVTRHVRARPKLVVHQVDVLHPKEVGEAKGFKVSGVSQTVLDLALERPTEAQRFVDEALRRKWMTLDRFEKTIERAGQRGGLEVVQALLHRYRGGDGPTESQLELKVLTLLREHGFPEPRVQRTVRVHGRFRRMDFLFEAQRVVLEADGYAWHPTSRRSSAIASVATS